MKKFLLIVLFCNTYNIYCQNNINKIDSVFNECFDFLKFYENEILNIHNEDSLCFFYEKREITVDFLENITGIFLKRIQKNHDIIVIQSDSVSNKWDEWYKNNKGKLIWIDDNTKIINPDSKWYKCASYVDYYPNNIRFRCKTNEIPKSVPPRYIKDLTENLHYKKGYIPVMIK